ncbi:hypothetical protein ACSLFT_22945 [Streptomyces sp. G6]|uniref:hypothetical protein n=1 Tax=Streptomyces sp. G6 TaxID=1178736 RepID=UPI003EDB39E3
MKALACGGGRQEPPLPPPPHPGAEEERKPYFATSADVTAPATHPAEAEVQR